VPLNGTSGVDVGSVAFDKNCLFIGPRGVSINFNMALSILGKCWNLKRFDFGTDLDGILTQIFYRL